MGFNFEKLDVYRLALEFADEIYRVTRKFPKEEQFGLTSQLRRAAVSIVANIAEGSGRYYKRDYAQFVRMSRGSVYECVALLQISMRQNYVNRGEYEHLTTKNNRIAMMLNKLIASLTK